jgi:hypothetical protein
MHDQNFSKVDLRSIYYHLKIKLSDMQNNTKYVFTLTQFWLINTPTYFMNLMNEVFME